jgi:hypothetical protein
VLLLSVDVAKDMVEGVIGGGDMGIVGDSGHRNLGRGDSSATLGKAGDDGPLAKLSLDRNGAEAECMNCLKAVTGLEWKCKRLDDRGGDEGVVGVCRPGELRGTKTEGSWKSRRTTTRVMCSDFLASLPETYSRAG